MTNYETEATGKYWSGWEIESGYKSIKHFMVATTSKNLMLQFFLLRVRVSAVLGPEVS